MKLTFKAMRILNRVLLFFAFIWIALDGMAQHTEETLKLYFETDVYDSVDQTELNLFLNSDRNPFDRVVIRGYADRRGSEEYNQHLSTQRAEFAEQLVVRALDDKAGIAFEVNGLGELANENLKESRRVDVTFHFPPLVERAEENEAETVVQEPRFFEEKKDVYDIKETEQQIVLEGLSFIPGRHYPTPDALPTLFKLLNTMKEYPALEIEIQGHICCSYDEFDGMDNDTGEPFLSRNRAHFVYEFLEENGIDVNRMKYKGLGSSQPKVYPELNDDDRQMNRRVEIKVLKQ